MVRISIKTISLGFSLEHLIEIFLKNILLECQKSMIFIIPRVNISLYCSISDIVDLQWRQKGGDINIKILNGFLLW